MGQKFFISLKNSAAAAVCATILASAVSASAKDDETRTCKTTFGGQVVCGNLTIGITLEQYEAGLKKRAEEIRGEEAEKHVQLQKLMELTERATSAEKDSLRSQIATVEVEKRALEAESKGVAERLTNLQASYDGLVQKLAEANATLEAFCAAGLEGCIRAGAGDAQPRRRTWGGAQVRRDRRYGSQDSLAGGRG